MKNKDVIQAVTTAAENAARDNGVELFDVDISGKGGSRIISVKLYSPVGISVDTCYRVHEVLDAFLEELDPYEENYFLEVASPGLDAKLTNDRTMGLCLGREVEFRTFVAKDWPKSGIGILKSFNDAEIVITLDGDDVAIDRKMMASLRLYFKF